MKKSTIITIICFALGIVLLAGCFVLFTDNNISNKLFGTTTTTTTTTSNQGETPDPAPVYEPMNFSKEDVSKYITLGQYKGLEIEVDQIEVSESDLDLQIHIILCQKDLHTKVLKGKTTQKVIFNFDYTGYLLKEDGTRGEAFQGGSSEGKGQLAYIDGNDLVTVSSSELGGFIDGFAQGMIGMSVGDTKTLNITFPENYHSTDMAGKEVEFDVKINYIAQTSFDDDAANYVSNGTYKTVKEYRDYLKKNGDANLKSYNEELIVTTVLDNVTVIEIPKQQFDYIYNALVQEVEYYMYMYSMYGQTYTFDQMLAMFGFSGTAALEQYAKDLIKSDLIYYAIIQAEALEITDEEYAALIAELVESLGKTEEEVIEQYGGEDAIKQNMLLDKAQKLIIRENVLVEKK